MCNFVGDFKTVLVTMGKLDVSALLLDFEKDKK